MALRFFNCELILRKMRRRGRQCGRISTSLLLIRYTTCVLISAAFFSRCLDLNFIYTIISHFCLGFWIFIFLFLPKFQLWCSVLNSCRGLEFYLIFWIDSFIVCLYLLGGTNYREAGLSASCLGEKASHTVWSGPRHSVQCGQGCAGERVGSKCWWIVWKVWCRTSWFCINSTGILLLCVLWWGLDSLRVLLWFEENSSSPLWCWVKDSIFFLYILLKIDSNTTLVFNWSLKCMNLGSNWMCPY